MHVQLSNQTIASRTISNFCVGGNLLFSNLPHVRFVVTNCKNYNCHHPSKEHVIALNSSISVGHGNSLQPISIPIMRVNVSHINCCSWNWCGWIFCAIFGIRLSMGRNLSQLGWYLYFYLFIYSHSVVHCPAFVSPCIIVILPKRYDTINFLKHWILNPWFGKTNQLICN